MSTNAITISDGANGAVTGNWSAITSSTYMSGAGTSVNLIYTGTPEATVSADVITPPESTRGKKKVKGEKQTEPGTYKSAYRIDNINPKIYFKFVKSKLTKIEVDTLKKRLNKIRPLLVQAEEMKQQALFEALSNQLAVLVREQEAFAIGHEKRIHRKYIEKFMKKVEDRCIKFEPLASFPRVIPAKVREKIKRVQESGVFDEFHILYIDHTGEELKTNKQKIKEKDPILFGRFNFQPDVFYFIVDWIDKYCDLTLSKLIDELQIDDPEFELDLLPEHYVSWKRKYKDRLIEVAKVTEEFAEDTFNAASAEIDYTDDPIEAADEEMSCWSA